MTLICTETGLEEYRRQSGDALVVQFWNANCVLGDYQKRSNNRWMMH